MPSTKDIRRRIKGVKSTGKITRAMEMISAVKMRRAVQNALGLRPYAESAWQVLGKVSEAGQLHSHPLLAARPVRQVLMVAVTSHRGLCGSFNAQVMRQVKGELEKLQNIERVDFVSLGKKGDVGLRRFSRTIVASFPEVVIEPTAEKVRPVAKMVLDAYSRAEYDQVMLVYTDYVSALVQKVRTRTLLPLSSLEMKASLNDMGESKHARPTESLRAEFVIEPEPQTVLEALVPRLLEMEIHHALLESNASQEAARMVAMRNASDAAKEMTDTLTLSYNQLRQAKVTQEIAELSAGMAAVGG